MLLTTVCNYAAELYLQAAKLTFFIKTRGVWSLCLVQTEEGRVEKMSSREGTAQAPRIGQNGILYIRKVPRTGEHLNNTADYTEWNRIKPESSHMLIVFHERVNSQRTGPLHTSDAAAAAVWINAECSGRWLLLWMSLPTSACLCSSVFLCMCACTCLHNRCRLHYHDKETARLNGTLLSPQGLRELDSKKFEFKLESNSRSFFFIFLRKFKLNIT